jgi:oligosaccharide repeat unit polymerase
MDLQLTIYNSIFFFCILFFSILKRKGVAISTYIIAVWFVSSIMSVFYVMAWGSFDRVSIYPYLYLWICFLIFLYPISKFNPKCLNDIKVENHLFLKWLIIGLSIIAILPLIENTIQAISVLTSGGDIISEMHSQRNNIGYDYDKAQYWLDPVGKICNSVTMKFVPLLPLLLIYSIVTKAKKAVIVGLIVLNLNPIMFNIAFGGRTSAAFFVMSAIFLVLLLKEQIPKKNLKRIFVYGCIVCVGLIVMMIVIANLRFSDSTESSFDILSLYLGEGMPNFNNSMWNIRMGTTGDNSFSFFKYIFGFDAITENTLRREHWHEGVTGVDPVRFYTIIGDWFSDLGAVGTFLLVVLLSVFIRKISRKKDSISFTSLYLFLSFCDIVLSGFTFYKYKMFPISVNFFVGLLICVIINFRFKRKYD